MGRFGLLASCAGGFGFAYFYSLCLCYLVCVFCLIGWFAGWLVGWIVIRCSGIYVRTLAVGLWFLAGSLPFGGVLVWLTGSTEAELLRFLLPQVAKLWW